MEETRIDLMKSLADGISDIQSTASEFDNVLRELEDRIAAISVDIRATQAMRADLDATMTGFVDLLQSVLNPPI